MHGVDHWFDNGFVTPEGTQLPEILDHVDRREKTVHIQETVKGSPCRKEVGGEKSGQHCHLVINEDRLGIV